MKENYSLDIDYGTDGVAHIKNYTMTSDMEALNGVLSKFKDIYSSNIELSNGFSKFSKYVNEIYDLVQHEANPQLNGTEEATASSSGDETDLVDMFIQEMEKSEEDKTIGADQLNKKLYKNYIKSLNASVVGGLLQQSS